jgi:hypothetical protein
MGCDTESRIYVDDAEAEVHAVKQPPLGSTISTMTRRKSRLLCTSFAFFAQAERNSL